MKGHFVVIFVLPHGVGLAWIQVPGCSLSYVLQGYVIGFSFAFMSSKLWMLQGGQLVVMCV